MSSIADKNLSQSAQDEITRYTQQAQSGQISWADANKAANEVRARENANYTVSSGGTTTFKDGSSISGNATGNKLSATKTNTSNANAAIRNQPSMTRNMSRAGTTVYENGYYTTYNENGYAVKQVKANRPEAESLYIATGGQAGTKPADYDLIFTGPGGTYQGGAVTVKGGSADYRQPQTTQAAQPAQNQQMTTSPASGYTETIAADAALDPALLAQIQSFRDQAKAGLISWDQANQAANAVRMGAGGYTVDKSGNVTRVTQQPQVQESQADAIPQTGTGGMRDYLNQWYQNAQQQQQSTVDYGTNQAILELIRNQQDAEAQYQEQRNQIAIDEAKAKDNQALYAEARGDKGGIGAAQYDAIMNTAAQNRLQVNSAQTKLATDTSRQIADLRAQGEYEKADALLQLGQQYLSQLMSLEQWAAEYNLSVAQFNASLQQWQAEFEVKVADLLGSYKGQQTLSAQQIAYSQQADQDQKLASAGEVLLAAGIMPSASQLAAMGLTTDQAQAYITAQKVAAAAKAKSSSSSGGGGGGGGKGGGGRGTGSSQDYDGLMTAARSAPDAKSFIANNYKKYGFTSSTGLYDYYNNTWLPNNQTADTLDPDKVNNPHGSKMVQIKKGNSYTYMTWASAADWIDKGKIKIRNDGNDTYTLVFVSE